jgi:hypothetical protein
MQAKRAKRTAVLGKTADGIVIYEPEFDPVEVSKARIRVVVEAVKRRDESVLQHKLLGVGKGGTEAASASDYTAASAASTD